jgi:hypothetical protein
MAAAPPPFTPRDIYRSFRADRNVALHRVLRRLPDTFIAALAEGLEQADVITPGRLFAGQSGGCAVGVTLRVLYPKYRGRRLLWGRRLRRSVIRLRRGLAPSSACRWLTSRARDELGLARRDRRRARLRVARGWTLCRIAA